MCHTTFSDNTDIFLKAAGSILLEQWDKSLPLHYTQYAVLPHHTEIVMWPQITVTSIHSTYNLTHMNAYGANEQR